MTGDRSLTCPACDGSKPAGETNTPRWPRRWPVTVISLPAAVATWSGWVGLGEMTGFGKVKLLPGIWDGLQINTAVTLPVGAEAYAAYALSAALTSAPVTGATRRYAWISSVCALALGMGAQVAYHLLRNSHHSAAPVQITTGVSCLPVLVLGLGAVLAHLLHRDRTAAVAAQSAGPADPAGVPAGPVPDLAPADARPYGGPDDAQTSAQPGHGERSKDAQVSAQPDHGERPDSERSDHGERSGDAQVSAQPSHGEHPDGERSDEGVADEIERWLSDQAGAPGALRELPPPIPSERPDGHTGQRPDGADTGADTGAGSGPDERSDERHSERPPGGRVSGDERSSDAGDERPVSPDAHPGTGERPARGRRAVSGRGERTERLQAVRALLAERPGMSGAQIAAELGIPTSTARRLRAQVLGEQR